MEESTGKERFPLITGLLIAANVLAFLYAEWQGSTLDADYMIRAGAMYGPAFFGEHEYYRIFTHFFLHFGFEHLLNNMVSLLAVFIFSPAYSPDWFLPLVWSLAERELLWYPVVPPGRSTV